MGPANHVLDGGHDLANLFAAMTGDKLVMQPLLLSYFRAALV